MAVRFALPSWTRLAAVVLPLLVAAVYWPGLHGGFAFDDFPNLVENTAVHVSSWDWRAWSAAAFSSEAGTFQRPLAMLSFALNHAFTGLDPAAMKATNIGIHALNTLLAMLLGHRLLRLTHPQRDVVPASIFTAAAWGLHPINLTAVLLVVQRMESLSHTFVIAGLVLYLHGRQRQLAGRTGTWWILAGIGGCGSLGLLSKESAVLLPLYALLVEMCLLHFKTHRGTFDRRIPLLATAMLGVVAIGGLAWLWPRVAPAYAMRDFTVGERLLTEARVVIDYLRWTVAPNLRELGLYHDDYRISHGLLDPPATAVALAAIAILLGLAIALRRRRPLVALGILWFFAAQLPTATILPLELMHEHRNYFGSFGLCLAVGDLLLGGAVPRRLAATAGLLLVAFLALATSLRAREWSDPYRFAHAEAAKHPTSPRATYALAQALVVRTGYDRASPALPAAFAALERARRVPDSGLLPGSGLLLLAANTGSPMPGEWWLDLQQRARSRVPAPSDVNAIATLTRCARNGACPFPPAQMQRLFQAATARVPNADLYTLHGDYALNVLHDPAQALHLWTQAVSLRPRVPQYRINLAKLLIHLGRDAEARAQIALLRSQGGLGQNEQAALDLERRLSGRASHQ